MDRSEQKRTASPEPREPATKRSRRMSSPPGSTESMAPRPSMTIDEAFRLLETQLGPCFTKWHRCFTQFLNPEKFVDFIQALTHLETPVLLESLTGETIDHDTKAQLMACGLAASIGRLEIMLRHLKPELKRAQMELEEQDERAQMELKRQKIRTNCAQVLVSELVPKEMNLVNFPAELRSDEKFLAVVTEMLNNLAAMEASEIKKQPLEVLCDAVNSESYKKAIRAFYDIWRPSGIATIDRSIFASLLEEPRIVLPKNVLKYGEEILQGWNANLKNKLNRPEYEDLTKMLLRERSDNVLAITAEKFADANGAIKKLYELCSSVALAKKFAEKAGDNEVTLARVIYQFFYLSSFSRLNPKIRDIYDYSYTFFAIVFGENDEMYTISIKPDVSLRFQASAQAPPILCFFCEEKIAESSMEENFRKSVFMAALQWKHYQFIARKLGVDDEKIPVIPFACCHKAQFSIHGLKYDTALKRFETTLLLESDCSSNEGIIKILYALDNMTEYLIEAFEQFWEYDFDSSKINQLKTKLKQAGSRRPPKTQEGQTTRSADQSKSDARFSSSTNLKQSVQNIVNRFNMALTEFYPTPRESGEELDDQITPLTRLRGHYDSNCHVVPCSFMRKKQAAFIKIAPAGTGRIQKECAILQKLSRTKCVPNVLASDIDKDGFAFMILDDVGDTNFTTVYKSAWLKFAKSLLTAVATIHDQGIIHADISPKNVCHRVKEKTEFIVTLIDFEQASEMENGTKNTKKKYGVHGTDGYVAPEDEHLNGNNRKALTIQSDLFSVGKVLKKAAAESLWTDPDFEPQRRIVEWFTDKNPSQRPNSAWEVLRTNSLMQ